ncbi:hypothetical protein QBC33DRAFT_329354 [Phialemonium atrogriseum]|uniref:Uncharacterized protein n=1 Tax=Phialemonium atrogriseum TaxID=1093897 RepID=A0AAJ0FII6_9PEZI|nr:uncharacterized protein QBC33DRAFT_329354 [Phialemonium atrogriseum]KAK1769646.1 hypothetical protein QBC33DRAFT_329354 [Phialemonium atrogriseum]
MLGSPTPQMARFWDLPIFGNHLPGRQARVAMPFAIPTPSPRSARFGTSTLPREWTATLPTEGTSTLPRKGSSAVCLRDRWLLGEAAGYRDVVSDLLHQSARSAIRPPPGLSTTSCPIAYVFNRNEIYKRVRARGPGGVITMTHRWEGSPSYKTNRHSWNGCACECYLCHRNSPPSAP